MSFRERLQQAASRGTSARAEKALADAAAALSEEECKRRHSSYRLKLVDHSENRLRELADELPGFRVEALMDERGWGVAAVRDDTTLVGGRRQNLFSRLQVVVSPFNEFRVLDISAKGTVRNKENFVRNHHQPIAEFDEAAFLSLVDRWVLDYAEMYAGA